MHHLRITERLHRRSAAGARDESKTRGHDTTHARSMFAISCEADYTRQRFREFFQDDRFLQSQPVAGGGWAFLAEPLSASGEWWSRRAGQTPRILVLSMVYKGWIWCAPGDPATGQGSCRTRLQGVIIGGPHADDEFGFPGGAHE